MTVKVGSTTILPIRPCKENAPQFQKLASLPMLRLEADHLLQYKEIGLFIESAVGVDIGRNPDMHTLFSLLWRIERSPYFLRRWSLRGISSPRWSEVMPHIVRILFHPTENKPWLPDIQLGYKKNFHNPTMVGGKGPIEVPGWEQKPFCELTVPTSLFGIVTEAVNDRKGVLKTFSAITRCAAETMTNIAAGKFEPPPKPEPNPRLEKQQDRLNKGLDQLKSDK
ncbi:hypothetical protein B0T21DRAFT_395896 [Apiosordaria backusii]|uniref:Uncharacterized protein n=1 Tax=Apiosordaria backusii TaxID=314023 RepID=A0AA40E178_9PEZI|nr:hypothetical protein B0T21DRAFT_395896 [Apiosordaria backusii]